MIIHRSIGKIFHRKLNWHFFNAVHFHLEIEKSRVLFSLIAIVDLIEQEKKITIWNTSLDQIFLFVFTIESTACRFDYSISFRRQLIRGHEREQKWCNEIKTLTIVVRGRKRGWSKTTTTLYWSSFCLLPQLQCDATFNQCKYDSSDVGQICMCEFIHHHFLLLRPDGYGQMQHPFDDVVSQLNCFYLSWI